MVTRLPVHRYPPGASRGVVGRAYDLRMLAAASSNTVAIVAIIVTGIVGVVAPIITSIASGRRLTRELNAGETRQEDALKAEQQRLEQQLTSESERLAATLDGDRQHARDDAIREVLDKGAILITEYGSTMSEAKASATPGHLDLSTRWLEVVGEVATHRNRLRLWFDDDEEVVQAFDNFLAYTNFYVEEKVKPPSPDQDAILKGIEEDFHDHRERYLSAARAQLAGSSDQRH